MNRIKQEFNLFVVSTQISNKDCKASNFYFYNLQKLRFCCPKYFKWIRIFPFARRKCVICEEPEPRKRN